MNLLWKKCLFKYFVHFQVGLFVGYFFGFWFILLNSLSSVYTWILTFYQIYSFGSDVKESTSNVGNLGSIPGLERSPGEVNGCSLQYSCLENSMDRGDWQATVHGFVKSWTWLSDFTFFFLFLLESIHIPWLVTIFLHQKSAISNVSLILLP